MRQRGDFHAAPTVTATLLLFVSAVSAQGAFSDRWSIPLAGGSSSAAAKSSATTNTLSTYTDSFSSGFANDANYLNDGTDVHTSASGQADAHARDDEADDYFGSGHDEYFISYDGGYDEDYTSYGAVYEDYIGDASSESMSATDIETNRDQDDKIDLSSYADTATSVYGGFFASAKADVLANGGIHAMTFDSCPAGLELNSQRTDCKSCRANYVKPEAGPEACTACPDNYVTVGNDRTTCTELVSSCPQGQQPDPATSGTTCETCPEDTFKAEAGLESCEECAFGFVTVGNDRTQCYQELTSCPIGEQPDPATRGTTCGTCPEDTFKAEAGLESCESCGSGYVTVGDDRAQCFEVLTSCPGGEQLDSETRDTTCEACSKDTINPSGTGTCTACAEGEITVGDQRLECTALVTSCPAGETPDPSTELTTCKSCPADTYKSEVGLGACTACPDSEVTLDDGSTSETDCLQQLTTCSPGDHPNPLTKKTTCSKCNALSISPDGTKCLLCPGNSLPNEERTKCLSTDPILA